MAPGSRPVDSEARGGLWLRKATRACSELGAPTTASGEAPLAARGGSLGIQQARTTVDEVGRTYGIDRAMSTRRGAAVQTRSTSITTATASASRVRRRPC